MAGFSWNFNIDEGKFTLMSDEDKAKDNLVFLFNFTWLSRIYMPEYNLNIGWVLQKAASSLMLLKTLVVSTIKEKITRFVPNVSIKALNTDYDREEKQYFIGIRYAYKDDGVEDNREIIEFI